MNQTLEQTKEKINNKVAQQIMDEFDFDKVLNYMQSVNWQYLGQPVDMDKIRSTARRCLYDAVDTFNDSGIPYGNCGTGGFTVTYFPWGMCLTFSLEHKRNY